MLKNESVREHEIFCVHLHVVTQICIRSKKLNPKQEAVLRVQPSSLFLIWSEGLRV